jgi:hypothetical protein
MDLTRKRLERGYSPRPTNPQPRRRGEFEVSDNNDFAGGTDSEDFSAGRTRDTGDVVWLDERSEEPSRKEGT